MFKFLGLEGINLTNSPSFVLSMDLWRIPRLRGRIVIMNLVILSHILRRITMITRCFFRQMWKGNGSWCPDVAAMQEG